MKALWAGLLLAPMLSFAVGGAPPVQQNREGGNGTILSKEFPSNVTAGNTLYIAVGQANTSWTMASGPSNSCGDTFTEASNSPITSTSGRIRIYTATTSGGCATQSMTSNTSAPFDTYIAEYSNIAEVDRVNCVSSGTGSGTSMTTGDCVTDLAETTLVAFAFKNASATYTAGASYTIESQASGTGHSFGMQDRNVSAAGTYTAPMTSSASGDWAMHVLAFANADQPSAQPTSLMILGE